MNLRTLSFAVAALVVLCAVVWFVRRPAAPATTDPRASQPVLAANLATQAARLKLTDQGKTVELSRQTDGSWTVVSYHDFPADFTKLTRLIGDLTSAKVSRLVTARADRLARLEFKDTTLALHDDAGKELWQITLGKNADGGGRYLRYGAEDKGYLANLSLWLDAEPKNWADSTLLSLKADDIARVEVGFTDPAMAPVIVNRAKKEDGWAPAPPTSASAGKRLKTASITSLLSNFAGLRFSDTTASDDAQAVAARAHARTLKFTTFDQKTYTVTLGRRPEEKMPKPAAPPAAPEANTRGESAGGERKPQEPEFETIPAGPVFASITSSDETARLNTLMQKRAFQIGEWVYTALPATAADLWEDAPAPPTEAAAEPASKGSQSE